MSNKIFFYFFSVASIFLGISGWFNGQYFFRGHWTKIDLLSSFILVLIGLISFTIGYTLPKQKTTKCPKCKEVFDYKDTLNGKCPHCKDVDTIDIKEYYEKFPDEKKSDL
jgi:phage FluMu protein Com